MPSQSAPDFVSVEGLACEQPAGAWLAAAVRELRQAVVVADAGEPDHPVVFASDAFLQMTGYPREEMLGRNLRMLQGEGTDPDTVRAMGRVLAEPRELAVEVLNYRKNGQPFWNKLVMSPVRHESGCVAYWFAAARDVTERKSAELALLDANDRLETAVEIRTEDLRATVEQKTLLLHEVEHRVKNNLQLIYSLIQFQARRTEEPGVREALREVLNRVSAVSTVHRRLFQTEDPGRFDVGQFLRDLVDDRLGRSGRPDVQVRFALAPVTAPASWAAPLALLVNEVLGHAVEAGLPADRGGTIDVRLQTADERFSILLGVDGPATARELRDGLGGSGGIVDVLRRQLRAEIDWLDNQRGAAALITLALERGA